MTDYDGDGKLDVLLGDFCTYLHVRTDLTPEEARTFEELRRKESEATKFLRDSMERLRAKFKEDLKGVPQSRWNTPENSARWQAAYKAMQESPDYKRHMEEYQRLQKEGLQYVDRTASGKRLGDDPAVAHGYVWLFRRK